jgi:hypothetical protein
MPTISEWLHSLKLDAQVNRFMDAGYDDYEFMICQMVSRHPITDLVLQRDIGIKKPGHRARILAKLHDEISIRTTTLNQTEVSMSIDAQGKSTACDMCILM